MHEKTLWRSKSSNRKVIYSLNYSNRTFISLLGNHLGKILDIALASALIYNNATAKCQHQLRWAYTKEVLRDAVNNTVTIRVLIDRGC